MALSNSAQPSNRLGAIFGALSAGSIHLTWDEQSHTIGSAARLLPSGSIFFKTSQEGDDISCLAYRVMVFHALLTANYGFAELTATQFSIQRQLPIIDSIDGFIEATRMSRDSSRLIMELEKHRREINRETINPTLPGVDVNVMLPVVRTCAKARADYIECLTQIADRSGEESCTPDQIDQLKQFREAYEELVAAANALETVIQRGYVDVKEG